MTKDRREEGRKGKKEKENPISHALSRPWVAVPSHLWNYKGTVGD